MCGIAGIISNNNNKYETEINRMIESLHHRGPDDNGSYFDDICSLGHTRLSIVDIEHGQQPMKSTASDTIIVLNGEIYGYKDLKKNLLDFNFKTKSDTEVVLALYDKYGVDMISHLPGMFAFAIWDNNLKRLFAARDRFGEKPFYYAFGSDGEFIFASEIKAILSTNLVKPVLNLDAVGHYLKYSYVHPHQCIYKNIYVLPPAHYLIYQNNNLIVKKYWDLPDTDTTKRNYENVLEEFEFLLKKSVQNQLIADVPVSIFLSGGLDSSTITLLANNFIKDISTFSFGFPDSEKNELHFARDIAQKYNTNHNEIIDDNFDLISALYEVNNIFDEPFADTSSVPTYLISKKVSKYSKVVLSGDGGDELLAGYICYRKLYQNNKIKNKKDYYNILLYLMIKFTKYFNIRVRYLRKKNDYILKWKNLKFSKMTDLYYQERSFCNNTDLKRLGLNFTDNIDSVLWKLDDSDMNNILKMDVNSYLLGDILVKTDRTSMACGLEVRCPFLDKDFAEFSLKLPFDYKMNNDFDKLILRKCFQNRWTPLIAKRGKQGFGPPLNKWLKDKRFLELKHNFLQKKDNNIYSILSYDQVQKDIQHSQRSFWDMLILSMWLEKRK